MTKHPSHLQPATLIRWIGSVLTLGLFGWLLAQQDWYRIRELVQAIPLGLLLLALVLFASGLLCNAWRWYVLLHAQRIAVTFLDLVKMVIAGSFASNFLPSTVGGDVVRLTGIMRFTDNWALGFGSLVLDRLLNVLAMVTTFPFVWIVFGSQLPLLATTAQPCARAGLLLWMRQRLPHRWQQLKSTLQVWLHQPLILVAGFLISWLSVLVIFIGIWVLARGLGMSLTLTQIIAVSALTYFATLVPISINGYGVQEVLFITLYIQLGAAPEQATSLTLLIRFLMLIETLPGVLWLPQLLTRSSE